MEGYKPLGTQWDRNMRFEEDRMYKELYQAVSNIAGKITDEVFMQIVDNAKLNWKSPVDEFELLPVDAEIGDTRMVRYIDENKNVSGKVYRYDGGEWKEIQQIDAGPVNELERRVTEQLDDKADKLFGNLVVNIPSDYSDLQEAIDDLSGYKTKQGVIITLNLESGYIINSVTHLENGDYSMFLITSSDSKVFADVQGNLFYGSNVVMPVLGCLIDMQGKGGTGYFVDNASKGVILPQCGIINSGHSGLYANTSTVKAEGAIFTGAASAMEQHTGITARRGSIINANGADVSGSHYYGLSATQGSFVSAVGANADNCHVYGMRARDGATLSASESTAKNCGQVGYYSLWEGHIDARGCDASGSLVGFYAAETGFINAKKAVFNGGETGLSLYRGGNINADNAVIKNTLSTSVLLKQGCSLNADSINITNSGGQGILAEEGCSVNAPYSIITTTELEAVWAFRHSSVNLQGAKIHGGRRGGVRSDTLSQVNARKAEISGSENGFDLNIVAGSQICAIETTFSTSLTDQFNYLHKQGIIWR